MPTWRMFCEAAGDHRTAAGLIDRVLRERGADWVRRQMEDTPESVRTWARDERGERWSDVHSVREVARSTGLRLPHGHFDGEPGAPGAQMVGNAVIVARAAMSEGDAVEAVVIVADLDHQPDERRKGFEQGRAWGERLLGDVPVVIGAPDPNREAWVLAGFTPCDEREAEALGAERQQLGFLPNERPERLTATGHTKRVLRALVGDDAAREEGCWSETPFDRLVARGAGCGLSDFLLDVERRLCPQVDGLTSRP